ncbi:unnamed protein product [Protopolystoma xenopodis]|uniref:Uncharacterized protein n=1 Tax=Protopolystoma xenopodis TaxID=117903 RepID=A0A3S5BBG6_9PLAT|nr:unnamed protein product [Protopolystoma xenopodis]
MQPHVPRPPEAGLPHVGNSIMNPSVRRRLDDWGLRKYGTSYRREAWQHVVLVRRPQPPLLSGYGQRLDLCLPVYTFCSEAGGTGQWGLTGEP